MSESESTTKIATATATVKTADGAPWLESDVTVIAGLPGVISVIIDPTDAAIINVSMSSTSVAAASATVRSIAKIFPRVPVKWNMA